VLFQQLGIVVEAANELAPTEDCYAEETLFGMLFGNGIDVIGCRDVVVCRCGEYISLEGRTELLGLFDFSIDFSNGELRWRPIALSLALHAGVSTILFSVNINSVLPLSRPAVAHELRVITNARKEIGANLLEFVPTWRWGKLFVVSVGHTPPSWAEWHVA
jgi:hypothetical protein